MYNFSVVRYDGYHKLNHTPCDNLCQTIHSHNCLPTSPLYRVLQFSVADQALFCFCCWPSSAASLPRRPPPKGCVSSRCASNSVTTRQCTACGTVRRIRPMRDSQSCGRSCVFPRTRPATRDVSSSFLRQCRM